MPFAPPTPPAQVEYSCVFLVKRKGSKAACAFASSEEARIEADEQNQNGHSARVVSRWMSKKMWDNAPEFAGY